jgi:Flp pilus assembly protein TadD
VEAESHYRAAAVLFEVMQDQAGTGRLLAELGRILLRRGRYADAVAQLQGAEARLPGDLAVQVDLARALRRSGQLWAATAVLGAALTVAPDSVDALVERGLIRIDTGEFSYALEDLDSAVRLRPHLGQQPEIRSARAFALARLGRTA